MNRLATLLEQQLGISANSVQQLLRRSLVVLAAAGFVLMATLIIAFYDIFIEFNPITTLRIGDIAQRDIVAPVSEPFVSDILTEEAREQAREAVPVEFFAPDPTVAQRQTQIAGQILDFIDNVRRDPYSTPVEKVDDLEQITALELSDRISNLILDFDDDTWNDIRSEILTVLPRVMRGAITADELETVRISLPTEVSFRFNANERDVIVAILEDLLRPNRFENVEATEQARDTAAESVAEVQRSFAPGLVIVREGDVIDELDYEALNELGLLRPNDLRLQEIARALLASTIVMVISGLYVLRFSPMLIYRDTRLLVLIGVLFLITLAGIRFAGINSNIYLFPSAALALLYVAIAGPHVAIVGSLALAILTGLMSGDSLEIATLIASGSIIGTLGLRRAERLNSFFVAGILVGFINAAVVGIFALRTATPASVDIAGQIAIAFLAGSLLVPATAITLMYVVTQAFNLPTLVKLLELGQPSKPLLQRLLREAPGTYQHSLMVANLAEQAAEAIGADAQLTHIAALYHDIGKMSNPIYFVENQQGISNPHDTLNDPYRSAEIIIGHVTEGDDMARQYRLPNRIRDFIREHHGTTNVFVFYQRALNQADGDEAAVDMRDFAYPGPKPRSRETAILMLADSCESTTRAMKPQSKREIREIVTNIMHKKRDEGQLDLSGLTLNELNVIEGVFVDTLLGVFHPRVNYAEAVQQKPTDTTRTVRNTSTENMSPRQRAASGDDVGLTRKRVETPITRPAEPPVPPDEDEAPLSEVPRLPRADERRSTSSQNVVRNNGLESSNNHGEEQAEPVPDPDGTKDHE